MLFEAVNDELSTSDALAVLGLKIDSHDRLRWYEALSMFLPVQKA
jgi:hypothetical protein